MAIDPAAILAAAGPGDIITAQGPGRLAVGTNFNPFAGLKSYGQTLAGVGGGIASTEVLSSILHPIFRDLGYLTNYVWENRVPEPGTIIEAWKKSDLSYDLMARELGWNGCRIRQGPNGKPVFDEAPNGFGATTTWMKLIESSQEPLPLEILIKLVQLGRISNADFHMYANRFGHKEETVRDALKQLPFLFNPDQERILFKLQSLPNRPLPVPRANAPQVPQNVIDTYRQRLAAAGIAHPDDKELFDTLIQPPTYHECIQLLNRDIIKEDEFRLLMALEGFTDDRVIDQLHELRKEIPSVPDLIEMSVKNVFDKDLSKALKLDEEFEKQPQYLIWSDRAGFTGNPFVEHDAFVSHSLAHGIPVAEAEERFRNQDRDLRSWAQAHWRSHWVNVSPTQVYEMLHRLRPIDFTKPGAQVAAEDMQHQLDRADGVEARAAILEHFAEQYGRVKFVPGTNEKVNPVTMDLVRTVLRADDYSPMWRGPLAAISYNVLRLVDIRRIVQLSLASDDFAKTAIEWQPVGNTGRDSDNRTREEFVHIWARESFLDRGQTPEAAQSLATLAIRQGLQTNRNQNLTSNRAGLRRYVRMLERAYRIGIISRNNFNDLATRESQHVDANVNADVQMVDDIYSDEYTAAVVASLAETNLIEDEMESV